MSDEKMREALQESVDYLDGNFGTNSIVSGSALHGRMRGALTQQTESEPVDDWLVYCLEYIGAGDPDDIECDAYELYAENDEGQSGTITVSISEICRKAAAALLRPQPSAQVPEESRTNAQLHGCEFPGWQCFHCGEIFTTVGGARDHFGGNPLAEPGCAIKIMTGDERGLLMELRKLQALTQVPEGWRLVPLEPTEHMKDCGYSAMPGVPEDGEETAVYKAMLTAAPSIAEKRDATLLAAPFARLNDQQQEEARRRFADARPGDGYLYCDHTDYARGAPGVVWVRRPEPPEPQP